MEKTPRKGYLLFRKSNKYANNSEMNIFRCCQAKRFRICLKKKCSSIDLIYLELQTLPGQAVSHHMWELFVLKRTVEAGKMWQTTPMQIIITMFVVGPTNLKNIGILKLIPNLTCGMYIQFPQFTWKIFTVSTECGLLR